MQEMDEKHISTKEMKTPIKKGSKNLGGEMFYFSTSFGADCPASIEVNSRIYVNMAIAENIAKVAQRYHEDLFQGANDWDAFWRVNFGRKW